MGQSNTLLKVFKSFVSMEEIENILRSHDYQEVGRKWLGTDQIFFWLLASSEQWQNYRESENKLKIDPSLKAVDHTTLSTKASILPYEAVKEILELLGSRFNRETRRSMDLPVSLAALDSTTMTVGENRLPWAPYHGKRNGVKMHTFFRVDTLLPIQVEASKGLTHDAAVAHSFSHQLITSVRDRAYATIRDFDNLEDEDKGFVIRLKTSIYTEEREPIPRVTSEHSRVFDDYSAKIGKGKKQSNHRFRIVCFYDDEGNTLRVATNLSTLFAEDIADLYKARWQIELFHRFLKQHLNLNHFFGTTPNAVYGQLFCAIMVYMVLRFLYNQLAPVWRMTRRTFIQFARELILGTSPLEVKDTLAQFLDDRKNITPT
ncbi:IS4 family transposase [Salicibibacter cibarius]|uniref:IS4 family transposase n=1 Tax=Salicibibacter cibarius TaxID=2743000 RepID=A0A7T6Z779_9BACI|nr:IS4 family transposase [Salicibibacter cibarius]QQK77636.1 IS4 family transposase [Salicibibacter cibarius]